MENEMTQTQAAEKLAAAGITAWTKKEGEFRYYDPRKRGSYLILEGGFSDNVLRPEDSKGKCSGAFHSQVRKALAA